MTLVQEYLDLTHKYISKYGEKTILLMQVGAFFNIYFTNYLRFSVLLFKEISFNSIFNFGYFFLNSFFNFKKEIL